jgi:hypothetical protein
MENQTEDPERDEDCADYSNQKAKPSKAAHKPVDEHEHANEAEGPYPEAGAVGRHGPSFPKLTVLEPTGLLTVQPKDRSTHLIHMSTAALGRARIDLEVLRHVSS